MIPLWHKISSTLRSIVHRRRLESEMESEIRFHIESRTDDLLRDGLSHREANRQARLEFGGISSHKDNMRASLGLRWLDELYADLAYASRIFRKSPGFTAIAVASLALAIGANTTIFSFANQMLFVHLRVPHPDQLRMLSLIGDDHSAVHSTWGNSYPADGGKFHFNSFSYPVYQQLRQQTRSTEELFA